MSKSDLRVDWATHKASKYACENWHYSGRMPSFGTVKIGVWEHGVFIGVVIFSRGATPEIGSPYGLKQTEICELSRVALRKHDTPVSRILRVAFKFLLVNSHGLKMVVSFADSAQNHHGGIYQAANWIYAGKAKTHAYRVLGIVEHPKSLHSKYGIGGQSIPWLKKNVDPTAERINGGDKHRYLMPLDAETRLKAESFSQPYPKRPKKHEFGDQPESGRGSTDPDAPILSGG